MDTIFNLATPRDALRGWFDRFNEIEVRGVRLQIRDHREVPEAFVVGVARRGVFETIPDPDQAFDKFFALLTRERVREIISKSRGAILTRVTH